MLIKWNYRIVEQEYDAGDNMYILETDKGQPGDEWFSLFRSANLEEVRSVRKAREERYRILMNTKVIE